MSKPALALVAALVAASTGDCYLVTSDRIEVIPCDFRAAITDARRYAERDAARSREAMGGALPQPRRAGPQPTAAAPPPGAGRGWTRRASAALR